MAEQPIKFQLEIDPRSVSRMSEAQLAELAKRVQKVLGGAKGGAPGSGGGGGRGGGASKPGGAGRLAGSLMGSALPMAMMNPRAMATAKLAEMDSWILEVMARRAGDVIEKYLPRSLNPLLKQLGIDRESIDKSIAGAVSKVREAIQVHQARFAAIQSGAGAATRIAQAAAATGTQNAVTLEHLGDAALVAYNSSMLDAEVRLQAKRRINRRMTEAVIDGLSATFTKTAGIGR